MITNAGMERTSICSQWVQICAATKEIAVEISQKARMRSHTSPSSTTPG